MICKEQFKIEKKKKKKWHRAENYTSTVCRFQIATHKGKSLPTRRKRERESRAEKRIRES